jgi:phosphoglycerol transferase MdoB-like AlkP superfamily enzyme
MQVTAALLNFRHVNLCLPATHAIQPGDGAPRPECPIHRRETLLHLSSNFAIFRRPALLALYVLAALSASRVLLVSELWERVEPTDGLFFILMQGVRFDLIVVAQLFGPVFVLAPWLHANAALRRIGAWLVPAYLALVCALGLFVEASTLAFIREFDVRPNYLFVEYLAYPKEIFAMLGSSHLEELVAFTAMAGLVGWKAFGWLRRDPALDQRVSWRFGWAVTPILAVLVALTIRSTLDHRPVNPGNAAFSQDAMVNQLALNSPYTLLYDIYERRRDQYNEGVSYGEMPANETLAVILEEAGLGPDGIHADIPTLHFQRATFRRERPLNLVIIVEESLGAEFVGSLGGQDLTPEIDRLADKGIWLERLYATGIRSVRGIETVVTGFPPTPRLAVVKLAETQIGFFTLPGLLHESGYDTQFFYGGRAHFDNMRRFFMNNGFRSIVDQADFVSPEWVGAWGVSDGDLFRRAHEEFESAGDQPFFALIFTTTHHAPFEIPEGKVKPIDGADGDRATAVRYADHALGRFLDLARQSDYWQDTVFYVTADHNSRVYGNQLVPVQRFHIPGAIVGGAVEPRRIPGITSQIDMLPTLLSLIGVDGAHPSIGRDLTRPQYSGGAGRAMMQFNRLQAYLENDRVVVLAPDEAPRHFQLQPATGQLFETDADAELARRALAYASWGPLTIRNNAYRSR